MSAPKRGLGRGLGALLGEPAALGAPASSAARDGVREIAVDAIRPNPHQPRTVFERSALDELKASVDAYGVLVPVIVRPKGDGFELVAGERRWRASAELGRATIPAIVRPGDDGETLEVAMIENLQREDLNPLEEAAGFAALIEERGYTQDQVAQRLGTSRPSVANALRLLALSDAIKALVAGGRLSAGHARALLSAPEHRREALAAQAVSQSLSVRVLERLAVASERPPRTPARLSPEDADFERRLRERFGTRVALIRGRRGGRVELRFGSEDELIRLGDLLVGNDER